MRISASRFKVMHIQVPLCCRFPQSQILFLFLTLISILFKVVPIWVISKKVWHFLEDWTLLKLSLIQGCAHSGYLSLLMPFTISNPVAFLTFNILDLFQGCSHLGYLSQVMPFTISNPVAPPTWIHSRLLASSVMEPLNKIQYLTKIFFLSVATKGSGLFVNRQTLPRIMD